MSRADRGGRGCSDRGNRGCVGGLRTSVNSISSMPSPVYQWRKALRRNIEVNCARTTIPHTVRRCTKTAGRARRSRVHRCGRGITCSATRFITSCMHVLLPQKPTDILRPLGGMSQIAHLRLLGIHCCAARSNARK